MNIFYLISEPMKKYLPGSILCARILFQQFYPNAQSLCFIGNVSVNS